VVLAVVYRCDLMYRLIKLHTRGFCHKIHLQDLTFSSKCFCMNMGLQLTFYTLFLHEWNNGKVKVLRAHVLQSIRITSITVYKMNACYII